MTSILDQYADETIPEEVSLEEPKPTKKKRQATKKDDNTTDIEEKREQLSILSVLGTIQSYTGQQMSLGDVKKLLAKDVQKYHNRYQVILGSQVTGTLVNTSIEATTELLSHILPIDDKDKLCLDLKENQMIKQELSNAAGYIVLKGGRFVALASGLLQVVKHVDFKSVINKESDNKEDTDIDKYIQDTVDKTLETS